MRLTEVKKNHQSPLRPSTKTAFTDPTHLGAWVAQRVKASAFSLGHDPRVLGSIPALGSLLGGEPASSSLSACLSAGL